MDSTVRRKLGKKNAVVADISATINVYPIWLGILDKPFFGLQFAGGIIPHETFIKRRELECRDDQEHLVMTILVMQIVPDYVTSLPAECFAAMRSHN